MAKLTDPEIIQALEDSKRIDRASTMNAEPYPIYKNESGYLCAGNRGINAVISIQDLKVTDWEIIPDEPLNQ